MTGKTILITRGVSDGEELTNELHALGFRVIHEPLTEIFLKHTARMELEQALDPEPDAIIVTSRYGVRAIAALSDIRDIAILCAGEATAEVAMSMGFTRVCVAGHTVQELVDYVVDAYDIGSRFLYASAEHVRAELDEELGNFGMQVQRIVLYEATASTHLSDTLVEQLRRNQIDGITFLSRRSAEVFMQLLAKAGAMETAENLEAYCLSDVIAEPLAETRWKAISVSREPTLASLVASMDNA